MKGAVMMIRKPPPQRLIPMIESDPIDAWIETPPWAPVTPPPYPSEPEPNDD